MRYLLKIKYDGSKFYGFQRLNNKSSVQKEIEDALFKIYGEKIEIKGAGRTDRGVHALAQMAHFDTDKKLPKLNLKEALNSLINDYIYIADVKKVEANLHARFSVKKKRYEYKIYMGEYNPIKKDYYWQLDRDLDINKMKKASKIFIGGHDFENFVSGQRKNYEAIITKIDFKKQQDTLIIGFEGKSFYRYMVRNLVGVLIDVGQGKASLEEVQAALDKKTNKKFRVAPPNGLYLVDIKY